jgi:hypothetical protein
VIWRAFCKTLFVYIMWAGLEETLPYNGLRTCRGIVFIVVIFLAVYAEIHDPQMMRLYAPERFEAAQMTGLPKCAVWEPLVSRGYTAVLYNRAARCHRKNLPSRTLSPPTRSSTPASQGYPPSCVCRTSLELANSI